MSDDDVAETDAGGTDDAATETGSVYVGIWKWVAES